jgi:hypothetical protein
MKTTLYVTKPDEIEFTLQVTMSLEKWKSLRDAIGEKWPGWEFRSKITDMILAAQKEFRPTPTQQGE